MKKIVILGGGFGGIRCAFDLSRRLGDTVEILLIDRAKAHQFTPALYEVASAYREASDSTLLKLRRSVSIAYGDIFEGTQVKHVRGEIVSADMDQKLIRLGDGEEISFDYCVVAIGSQATDYGIPGVIQYAHFFKTLADALKVNIRIHELFRSYLISARDKPLQVILAGAGFTGIELASELAVCLRRLGRMHGIHKKFFSIMVFEAAPQMMPMLNTQERSALMKRLTDIGVGTSDHSPIESVHADHIKLANGHEWRGDIIIWTAGTKPNQLLSHISGIVLNPHGKIAVDLNLRVQNIAHVFAVGDSIEYADPRTQQPVPALAYHAIDQAKLVARNIEASIRGKKLHEYHPQKTSWIAPVGGTFALAHIGDTVTFTGYTGWLIKWLVDFRYFVSILSFSRAVKLLKKDFLLFSQNDS